MINDSLTKVDDVNESFNEDLYQINNIVLQQF